MRNCRTRKFRDVEPLEARFLFFSFLHPFTRCLTYLRGVGCIRPLRDLRVFATLPCLIYSSLIECPDRRYVRLTEPADKLPAKKGQPSYRPCEPDWIQREMCEKAASMTKIRGLSAL